MKTFCIHLESESSDHYYIVIQANKEPSEARILKWWDESSKYGEDSEYLSVKNISDVSMVDGVIND